MIEELIAASKKETSRRLDRLRRSPSLDSEEIAVQSQMVLEIAREYEKWLVDRAKEEQEV